MCKNSNAQARQSWIVLDFINPYCFLWIKEIIDGCNLFARSLVIIFIEVLRSEIGLKSPTYFGLSTYGIRVMKEVLMLLRHTLLLKKS